MGSKATDINRSLMVLIIEDNDVDRRMIESMIMDPAIKDQFTFQSVSSLKQARSALKKHSFDIAILDLNLPDHKGKNSLKIIASEFPLLPIVVNTGAYEDDTGIQTLALGAQEFLVKGRYNVHVLNKVLHYAVERKRLELRLMDALGKIEETQKQLFRAEKLKIVGNLASGIAHEVKNPLATILYGVTYLEEKIKDKNKEIKNVIATIKLATERANEIINDLLDFSGISEMKMADEDLGVLVKKTLKFIHHEAERRSIKVDVKIDRELPKVMVDRNRIEQVLLNLYLNSLHAIQNEGSIRIKCRTKLLAESDKDVPVSKYNGFRPGDKIVLLSVEDNGCGLPSDKIDEVFNPFFTTKRGQGGVGLGLSVSQNIMERHQGKILLSNRKQGGTKALLLFKIQGGEEK